MNESDTDRRDPVLAHSRIWKDGVCIDQDVTPQDMIEASRDPETLVWLDLLRPSHEALSSIAQRLNLPKTAVEDALAPDERPKVTRHDSHLFFTVYGASLGEGGKVESGRLLTSRVSAIVTPMALITIRLDDGIDMDDVLRRWEEDPELLKEGSGALVHGLLDYVVDGHFETIQAIDDATEGLEDILFDNHTTNVAFQRTIYGLRKDLVALRRVVLPMREVVNGLLRHNEESRVLEPWYDDLYDHVLRASEWTESLRDMVTSLFETNLSLQDARLNTIMKKLAGWAAIIAVPTLITGWFGQNVPYPGFSVEAGYVLSLCLCIVSVVGLYILFKKFDWV